jgi:V8-like Glu-specific endopeptidase
LRASARAPNLGRVGRSVVWWSRLAALAALSGCAPDEHPARATSPIVGGVKDTGDPAVVLLVGYQAGSYALCTAELVSPHIVVTAAHCVDPAVLGEPTMFAIFVGDDFNNPAQQMAPENFVPVTETHFDPAWDANDVGAGHDVAVAVLAKPLGIQPIEMNRAPLEVSDIGSPVRLVGYGITSVLGNGEAKRQVTTPIKTIDPVLVTAGDATHNTCEGDSGGAWFVTRCGREVLAGITSFGDVGCQSFGAANRVDTIGVPFVQPYIDQFDPGSNADAGAGGCGGSGPAPQCTGDAECGNEASGKVCVDEQCVDGCRGKMGNGCPDDFVCSSTNAIAGTCTPADHDAFGTGISEDPNGVYAEGAGIVCASSPRPSSPGASWVFGAAFAIAFAVKRRRARA